MSISRCSTIRCSSSSVENDRNIPLKLLIVFLFDDDQVSMTDQYHLHSSNEFDSRLNNNQKEKKKFISDSPYSHSSSFRQQRRGRFFNRSSRLTRNHFPLLSINFSLLIFLTTEDKPRPSLSSSSFLFSDTSWPFRLISFLSWLSVVVRVFVKMLEIIFSRWVTFVRVWSWRSLDHLPWSMVSSVNFSIIFWSVWLVWVYGFRHSSLWSVFIQWWFSLDSGSNSLTLLVLWYYASWVSGAAEWILRWGAHDIFFNFLRVSGRFFVRFCWEKKVFCESFQKLRRLKPPPRFRRLCIRQTLETQRSFRSLVVSWMSVSGASFGWSGVTNDRSENVVEFPSIIDSPCRQWSWSGDASMLMIRAVICSDGCGRIPKELRSMTNR